MTQLSELLNWVFAVQRQQSITEKSIQETSYG